MILILSDEDKQERSKKSKWQNHSKQNVNENIKEAAVKVKEINNSGIILTFADWRSSLDGPDAPN